MPASVDGRQDAPDFLLEIDVSPFRGQELGPTGASRENFKIVDQPGPGVMKVEVVPVDPTAATPGIS